MISQLVKLMYPFQATGAIDVGGVTTGESTDVPDKVSVKVSWLVLRYKAPTITQSLFYYYCVAFSSGVALFI